MEEDKNMKKILSLLAFIMGVFAFSSCVSDVDDVFSDSAANRAQKALTETRTLLESAPNGWRVEYYGDVTYGGYNVFMKFEGDSVTVASEKVGKGQTAGYDANGNALTCKSHFKLEQSMGVVLSLDDYNSIFHYFAEPKNDDFGTAGTGFEGDFEFRVVSASAEKIELQGKKHGDRIYMYPMAADMSWGEYMKQVDEAEEFMTSRTYTLQWGEDTENAIYTQSTYRCLNFYTTDKDGKVQVVAAPYIVTPEGYKFYKEVTVKDTKLNGFTKGDTQDFFVATGVENVKLFTEVPTLFDTFKRGLWYLTYDDMGTYGQSKWETLFEKLGKADNDKKRARLYYAAVGYVSDKYPAGLLMSTATESQVIIGMTFNAVSDGNGGYYGDRVEMKSNVGKSNNPGKKYYKNDKYGGMSAVDPFCSGFGHTFQITTDNVRHPSYLILTDLKDPTNVIKVWAQSKGYPFGDRDKEEKE